MCWYCSLVLVRPHRRYIREGCFCFGKVVFLKVMSVVDAMHDVRVGGFFLLQVGSRDLAMARWGLT